MNTKMTHDALEALIASASHAGLLAGAAVVPATMHIAGYAPIKEGVCGFAWVNVKPAYCQVAKVLVEKGLARKDSYLGGVTVWISDWNQSMTRKEAHARAFAEVLRAAGVNARADSRMD